MKTEGGTGEVAEKSATLFTLSQPIGVNVLPTLSNQYTVLDEKKARDLLGEGIATNFYVLELSVVNPRHQDRGDPAALEFRRRSSGFMVSSR